MNPYRRRILNELVPLLRGIPVVERVLDVGAGDGWFAMSVQRMGICKAVTAVDIMPRPRPYHQVEIYDGTQLPFPDNAFDLVYAIDVVHHATDPSKLLAEMARCTKRFVLLKDHTWSTRIGWLALVAMDEIGNRRFGVPSIYNYQRGWEWDPILYRAGFERMDHIHPCLAIRGSSVV